MLITENQIPEILFISSYPPRECGIATYTEDLARALDNKFDKSFAISICALQAEKDIYNYPEEVKFILDTSNPASYKKTASSINNSAVQLVMVQHEFGFFAEGHEEDFSSFMFALEKPVILTFHTVLPHPDNKLFLNVKKLSSYCHSIVVMTKSSADILIKDYSIPAKKITIIPHGVHLVPHSEKSALKEKYGFQDCTVLSTFGLIGPGKSIETSLDALPAIVSKNAKVLFLVIGKTHPNIVKHDGEVYREMLEQKVKQLGLQKYVRFINSYLPLEDLLEYLRLTDIYLFTSKDPNQAVSGTFSYAISCGCPIISTPIPHAREVLKDDAGIIVNFEDSAALSSAVNLLIDDPERARTFSNNGLQRIVSSAWENVSITYGNLFNKIDSGIKLEFKIPEIKLSHLKYLTTPIGIAQFARIDEPDLEFGYTLDDNARALVAVVMHYDLTRDKEDVPYIATFLNFIAFCQQENGSFLNYVDKQKRFTSQNEETNLQDSNGRTIWALGLLISHKSILPTAIINHACDLFSTVLEKFHQVHSTRAMAFALKGLYYYNKGKENTEYLLLADLLAGRLVQMYKHEGELQWEWFESYLTYGNSVLPESLLCAYQLTGNLIYKEVAQASLAFLLTKTFNDEGIKVITNKQWLLKGASAGGFGEQPIDVAYTVMALDRFYEVFKDLEHLVKLSTAFNWFLGQNHLQQIIYNPGTGGCYDGLEEYQINLNQGAESTISYLLARLTIEKYLNKDKINVEKLSEDALPAVRL